MAENRTAEQFNRDLGDGRRFEDYAVRLLWEHGWIVLVHRSAHYQWEHGESVGGVEIKLDRNYRKTNRLYIETAERRTTDGLSRWRLAGIYEEPRPKIYAIGDEDCIFMLATSWLHNTEGDYVHHEGPTAKGFLVPVLLARKWAIDVVTPGAVDYRTRAAM